MRLVYFRCLWKVSRKLGWQGMVSFQQVSACAAPRKLVSRGPGQRSLNLQGPITLSGRHTLLLSKSEEKNSKGRNRSSLDRANG